MGGPQWRCASQCDECLGWVAHGDPVGVDDCKKSKMGGD